MYMIGKGINMKKIILILLMFLIPFIALASINGDVDGNGIVSVLDYISIRKHILKIEILTADKLKRADVNNDDTINVQDYIIIRKTILSKNIITTPTNNTTGDICYNLAVLEKRNFLDYKDFISNNRKDDFTAIKKTHDCANKYHLSVIVTKDTYHIYKNNFSKIIVETNTDLNNSTIYIHDENIVNKEKNDGKSYATGSIYYILNNNCIEETNVKLSNLGYQHTIPELKKYTPSYVTIENENEKVFKRFGSNENGSGTNIMDSFRVKDGKILDPLFWEYNNITKMTACPIPSQKLTFTNAIFYNIVDTSDYSNMTTHDVTGGAYVRRGLRIERSNTLISNINHGYVKYDNTNKKFKTTDTITYQYNGFFDIRNATNIELSNCKVQALKIDNQFKHASYDIYLDNVSNIIINDVTMNDYNEKNKSEYLTQSKNQLNKDLWGVTGTHHVKNVQYKNCVLNRIDTHQGVYNLSVEDTIIGRYALTQIGFGNMNIKNVDVYYTNTFIHLRTDYGSTWNGNINITNSAIHPGNNSKIHLIDFDIEFDNTKIVHNFGYDLYLPKVIVDNFKIDSSSNELYIFNNSNIFNNKYFDNNFIEKNKGNLSIIKNYIPKDKNGKIEFNYYYPNAKEIKATNVTNNNSTVKVQNYVIDFKED